MDETLGSGSAEDRLRRLINRMMISAEAAASSGAWDRVQDIASDILVAAPDHQGAAAMLERARVEQSLPEGHRAFVSLIFSDIVKSTALADAAEPEVVRDLYRVYRQVATETIEGLGGHVLQFLGDGVFACFGYPIVHEDDAARAVLAGLGLVERMEAAGPELCRRYGIEPAIRVGVHTGTVVIAGLTEAGTDSNNIVGVAAHVAARLQSEATAGTVVVSDATKDLVDRYVEVVSIGKRVLRGVTRPIEVFRVLRQREAGRPVASGPVQQLSVVGREKVRRRLHATWASVLEASRHDHDRPKQRSVVVLRGPAGIGKSRLAADLCERVRDDGGAILQASCSPYHTNVALWPIAQMIEHRLGVYPQQPAEQRLGELERRLGARGFDKAAVVPLLAPLLGLDADSAGSRPEVDPLALRAETLHALVDWLARFALTTPTLLLVEDLHWSDPTTVELLGILARDIASGVMLLVTDRENLTAPWASYAEEIELGPLPEDDAARMVAAIVPEGGLSPARCRLIVDRSGGVPLYIQELARSALASTTGDDSPEESNALDTVLVERVAGETVPARLQELLAARIRSPGIDLRVTQLAAAIGSVFDEELLRELAGGPVIEALAQLQTAGIIEPVGDARRSQYRFRHVLLRDAAYETQVMDVRRATHSRVAQLLSLTATSPGDMAVVAQHHDLAASVEEAIPAYLAAAQAAQAEASHTEARRLLDRVLELLSSLPPSDERDLTELSARMLRVLSVSSLFGYGYEEVLSDLRLADAICRLHRDRPEIMPAQVGIWSSVLVRGDLASARVVLEPLVSSLEAPETAWFAPEIKSCLGFNAFYGGDLREARRWLEGAWGGYMDRMGEPSVSPFWPLPNDPVPITAVALACVAGLEGCTEESATWERRALGTAEQIGFPRGPFSAAFVTTYLAWLRMIEGDTTAARSFGRRTLDIAAQYRFDYFTAVGRQYALVPDAGQPVDMEELARCEVAMDLVGHGAFRPVFHGLVARNHVCQGELPAALERVNEALLQVEKSGELVHRPELLRLRADISLASRPERAEDAVADLRAAVDTAAQQGSMVLALRAAVSMARLPAEVRPEDWRDVLEATLARVPEGSLSAEVGIGRSILGG